MEKEQVILEEIKAFLKKEKVMPTIRYLQKRLNYHSTNSIYYYLKKLENKGYLIRNNSNQLIINDFYLINENIKIIPVINEKNIFVYEVYPKTKKYIAFKLKNNYFLKDNLLKNDLLIIEKKNALDDNDLGLFIINKQYRIMKYHKKNDFYLLEDYELVILNKVKIVGKVISLKRIIKRLG